MIEEISKNKVQKNFRLAGETVKKLEDYAEITGEDMTAILERALDKFLDLVALDVADEQAERANRIRAHVKHSKRELNSKPEPSEKHGVISSASTGRILTKYKLKGKADDSNG